MAAMMSSHNAANAMVRIAVAALALVPACVTRIDDEGDRTRASVVALIATPQHFDQMRIRTSGFLVVADEMSALFLSKLDGDHTISENGIWLATVHAPAGLQSASGSYVVLDGTFSMRRKGPMDMFAGSIEAITRVAVLPAAVSSAFQKHPEHPRGASGQPTGGGGTAYFLGFSGYALPLVPIDQVSKSEAEKHRSHLRAEYDAGGRLVRLEKRLDGEVFFRHEYFYFAAGALQEARVADRDGRLVIHTFDESGTRLDSR